MLCIEQMYYIRLKILRTMPTGYQNPISIIISVVLVVLYYRTLNLTDFGGGPNGPNGPKIKNCITGRAGPKNIVILPSLVCTRDGNGPGRPRAGPELPGPRASRA